MQNCLAKYPRLPKDHLIRIDKDQPGNPYPFRIYQDQEGIRYPSVTSLLSKTKSQEDIDSLNVWRDRVGVDEAERVSNFSLRRGSRMHGVQEAFLLQEEATLKCRMAELDVVEKAAWKPLQTVLEQRLQAFYAIEFQMVSRRFRIAGTLDLAGLFDGKKSIIDLKTSRSDKKREMIDDYFLQCDIYASMWRERFYEDIEQLVIVMVSEESNVPLVFIEPAYQYINKLKEKRLSFWNAFGV